jgi:serine/threonine-protein kinase HipA
MAMVKQWIRHLTFRTAIGDNDAHAKNVALIHLPGQTALAPLYDAVPNFFQEGLVVWRLALGIDGLFDHRRISAAHLLAEVRSWSLVSTSIAEAIIHTTLNELAGAIDIVPVPEGASNRMADHLRLSVRRLLNGQEIGESP